MKRLIVVLALMLAAPSVWAVVGCTVYTRSSDGNDGDDGSTWALANATINGSVADWGTSDIICIEDNHNESTAGQVVLTPTGDDEQIPVPVFSVSDVDDSYSVGSSCQISVTGTGNDLSFDGNFTLWGVFLCSGDDLILFSVAAEDYGYLRDVSVTLTSAGAVIRPGVQGARGVARWDGGTINFSNASGGDIRIMRVGFLELNGIVFAGNINSLGLFRGEGGNSGLGGYRCVGCDLTAYSGGLMADVSVTIGSDYILELIGSLLPTSIVFHDDAFIQPRQWVYVSGTDDATDNEGFRQDLYGFMGDITTDTGVYHDAGLVYTEGSTNASFKFEPASHLSKNETALCSPPRTEWISTTGSKTFTTEGIENFTTALDDAEVWQDIFYLGTTSSPDWSQDTGQVIGGTTALTAGTGLANWTGEPAGSRSFKLETTVTVNKVGLYKIYWCVASFESAKVVHIDPKPTIS